MTLVLNGHLQKSYPHKQHLEWLRAAPDGLTETDSIVLQMILKMCWVSDCAMLNRMTKTQSHCNSSLVLHFGKVVAIYMNSYNLFYTFTYDLLTSQWWVCFWDEVWGGSYAALILTCLLFSNNSTFLYDSHHANSYEIDTSWRTYIFLWD